MSSFFKSADNKKEYLEKYNGSAKDFAKSLNISIGKAYQLIKEHDLRSKLLPKGKDELQDLYDKLTMTEIADRFQVSRQTVYNWIKSHGIVLSKAKARSLVSNVKHTKEQVETVYAAESSASLAAKRLGITKYHFCFLLKHYDIPTRMGAPRKVKPDLLLEDFNEMSYTHLAEKYDVNPHFIYRQGKRLGLTKTVIIRRKNLKRFSLSKEYCEANKERPYFEIAKELGCCVFTVFKAMKKHKISKKRACNISVEDYQSYLDGVLSEDDLKVKYDFPIKTIRLALRRIEK